jgi:hypothetical protein
MVQDPLTHAAVLFGPLGHTLPQVPQLLGSFVRLASHPLVASPSQFPNPALHWARVQVPDVHVLPAFWSEQVVPHVPQLFGSLVVSTVLSARFEICWPAESVTCVACSIPADVWTTTV